MHRKIQKSRGFTLMELLMVMVVLAVIMIIAVPQFAGQKTRAKEAALKADLMLLRTAIANFQSDTGGYSPEALVDLAALNVSNNAWWSDGVEYAITPSLWHGPYMSVPQDPMTRVANWTYSTTVGSIGAVHSSSAGIALDGTAYNTW